MIEINDVEILTIQDGMNFSGASDQVARTLTFSYMFAPNDDRLPIYKASVGDKVRWTADNKTLFYGYVENIDYTTDDNIINVSCIDLSIRLLKSKAVGRFRGTLNELADKICAQFGLKNGIQSDSTHVHNIVSDGDLSYYDVLNTACRAVYDKYCLYLDELTLKIVDQEVKHDLTIGQNIRVSSFSSSIDEMVTKVVIIDNDGKVIGSVQDDDAIEKFGLFQETYSYNKDVKNNKSEARKLLKTVENKAVVVVDNYNDVISGSFVRINEPINNFIGIFEVITDSHTIETNNSSMQLEVKYVKAG